MSDQQLLHEKTISTVVVLSLRHLVHDELIRLCVCFITAGPRLFGNYLIYYRVGGSGEGPLSLSEGFLLQRTPKAPPKRDTGDN